MKICLLCKNISMDMGSRGYSEYTPGSEWCFECSKCHWSMGGEDTTDDQYRKDILTATNCSDYKEISNK